MTSTTTSSKTRVGLLVGGLHLAVLWAFGFVQPLFDLLSKNADFFVARHNGRADIIVYSIAYTLLPPLAMLAVEAIAERIKPSVRWGVHLTFVALLTAAIALQVVDGIIPRPAGLLIAVALGLGTLGAFAYQRTSFVPQALSVLSPAPLVFLAIFLLSGDVSKLVLPQKQVQAANVKITARTPVVWITFDEFPASSIMDPRERIDRTRFPNFAALARTSTWWRNYTTGEEFTTRAIPAMLTGRDPGFNKLPIASDQPDNLFTLLGGKGKYRVVANETETGLCPSTVCKGGSTIGKPPVPPFRTRMDDLVSDLSLVSEHLLLPEGIREHLPSVDQTFSNFRGSGDSGSAASSQNSNFYNSKNHLAAPHVPKSLVAQGSHLSRPEIWQRFVSSINRDLRSLYFIYWNIPHFPWQYLPSGQEYGSHPGAERAAFRAGLGDTQWTKNAWLVDHALQRHLLQVAYADHLLGQMIDRMKRLGIWDKALVIVTSDHGISFRPGGYRRLASMENLPDISSLPMFIKKPGQRRGRIDDVHQCNTDVLPVIAHTLHIALPWKIDPCPKDTVELQNAKKQLLTMSLPDFLRSRGGLVAHEAALFGSGDGDAGLYKWGAHEDLIGRSPATLPQVSQDGAHLNLVEPEVYANVDPSGPLLPLLLAGVINGIGADQPLAIAVNGKIASVAQSYSSTRGKARILAMIPPSSLRPGANSILVYRVEAPAGKVALQPLGGTGG